MRPLPCLLLVALILGSGASQAQASPTGAGAKSGAGTKIAAPSAKRADPAKKTAATAPGKAAAAPRTLDAVHIEGELDVPEVLFITARDQRRIVGFQHRRYLPGSAEVAKSTPLPSHVVVGRKPAPPREENSR